MPPKLALAHCPTPLWRSDALDALVSTRVWVKRDDMTGGPEAGNKIRKLEYLLADAGLSGANVVITCGGIQSNHARATALLATSLGMRTVLMLRTSTPNAPLPLAGNVLLDRLAGAEIRLISPEEYTHRRELMAQVAEELAAAGERPYVIDEGGSSALGALGYFDAMREIRQQLDLGLGGGPDGFDAVVHACGSGGTAAGCVLGAAHFDVAPVVHAIAVCDDVAYFDGVVRRIVDDAKDLAAPTEMAELRIHDRYKGPAYAVASDEQRHFIVQVARKTGLVLDPVYTGKALFALSRLEEKPARALFLHTGGLPGLLAQGDAFENELR